MCEQMIGYFKNMWSIFARPHVRVSPRLSMAIMNIICKINIICI